VADCAIFHRDGLPAAGAIRDLASCLQRNLPLAKGLFWPKEHQMADNKKPNEKQPGEHPEGEYHYNPGNQSGKTAKVVPKEEANENDAPHRERP
jgi:hypothetical protein